jgi:superfamily I DNA/RNA helicase
MTSYAPTDEQQLIIDAARGGDHLVIQAGAGTGKTSTLEMTSNAMTDRSILYVAFNKTTADDAAKRFAPHVHCRTAHSLAFRAVGVNFKERLNGPRQPSFITADLLNLPKKTIDLGNDIKIKRNPLATIVMNTVRKFCYSADTEIDLHHVPFQHGVVRDQHDQLAKIVLPYAQKAWKDITSKTGVLRFEHDFYLKMWALTGPSLGTDTVMLDEGQDSNPVLVDLIQRQYDSQQIVVGDTYQSMYQWRGSVDALSSWDNATTLYLSQSWRFGQVIADEANKWLGVLGSQMQLKGNPGQDSILATLPAPDAILCRTNAGAMRAVMEQLAADHTVALVGGGKPLVYLVESLAALYNGKTTSHPELFVFADWGQLRTYVNEEGTDLKAVVDMVEREGPQTLLAALNKLVPETGADVVVSTAHKAKGREWPTVRIGPDFAAPKDPNALPEDISDAEAMVNYVAVTRARQELDRGSLAWIDKAMGARV